MYSDQPVADTDCRGKRSCFGQHQRAPVPYMDRIIRQAVPMIMTAVMTVMMVHYADFEAGLEKALRTD